jgi:aminomethyltransferase
METTLYHTHIDLGGKIVEFAGWQMPIQYRGILQEHKVVREEAGIFDVSHMGRIIVEGVDAEKFLDFISTNKITGRPDNSATYTVLPNERGTCVDDVIIYKQDSTHFFLIVNAGNRQKDLAHLKKYAAPFSVTITDRFDSEGILCLQGPKAVGLVSSLFPEVSTLKKMQFINVSYKNTPLIIATTGYTGESGVEIYAPLNVLQPLWDHFTHSGATPIGLGARDTLRLEMGFALYGHELSDDIYPQESVSAWTIKWDGRDFVGKNAMLERKRTSHRCQRGVMLEEKGIPREGYPVLIDGRPAGKVTSGTFSPSLEKGIAIVQFDNEVQDGQTVEIQIRQQQARGRIVPLPFYHKRTS